MQTDAEAEFPEREASRGRKREIERVRRIAESLERRLEQVAKQRLVRKCALARKMRDAAGVDEEAADAQRICRREVRSFEHRGEAFEGLAQVGTVTDAEPR